MILSNNTSIKKYSGAIHINTCMDILIMETRFINNTAYHAGAITVKYYYLNYLK